MSAKPLNSENWKVEANAVINDIKNYVTEIALSEKIQSTNQRIVLNLTTLEKECYCIELSGSGFRIIGEGYDSSTVNDEVYYETPYSLLNKISPLFIESFGAALLNKLDDI